MSSFDIYMFEDDVYAVHQFYSKHVCVIHLSGPEPDKMHVIVFHMLSKDIDRAVCEWKDMKILGIHVYNKHVLKNDNSKESYLNPIIVIRDKEVKWSRAQRVICREV